MFFLAGAAIVAAVSAAVIARVRECHVSMSDLLSAMARERLAEVQALPAPALDTARILRPEPSDASFTESLLALGRVGLRVPGDFPAPASAEVSSLVSVHQTQSKNRDRVL